ncbi:MAG: Holliday junction branch migration protein RuvA [Clostridia bacterium]|nr:Holliday junction branch migration protein RuvA [Clostridia bacterium]MBO7407737.1 Holliday junction branch migration protein RuvA [Clostridia bacterium]
MFEYISGTLEQTGPDYCVVDVAGIGFKLNTSARVAAMAGHKGDHVKLYTFLNVKEDELSLFGFGSKEELAAFEMLITVSGVGPKVAQAVLNTLSPSEFCLAVATGDYKAISRSKGVGPKLAQRVVLELKDKVAKDLGAEKAPDIAVEAVPAGYIGGDAVAALMVLGYSSKEASDAVRRVFKEGMTLEETVRLALRQV